jgi:hypothetical protein
MHEALVNEVQKLLEKKAALEANLKTSKEKINDTTSHKQKSAVIAE